MAASDAPLATTDLAAADQAYKSNPQPTAVPGYRLIASTATLKLYVRDSGVMTRSRKNTLLLAVRGTADWQDVKADTALVFNMLPTTARYQADKATVSRWMRDYPPATNDWFLTGHSLGNAVALQLQRDFPFIKSVVGFNGAMEPRDILSQGGVPQDVEYYQAADPLFRTAGFLWRNKRVLGSANSVMKDPLSLPGAAQALLAHKLSAFKPEDVAAASGQ